MQQLLEKVKAYADRAHDDQTRKYSNDRYIVHPVRVMQICERYSNDVSVLAAALLHDVLEDTPVTKEQLSEFLESIMNKVEASRTLRLVVELTDIYTKANYPQLSRKERKRREEERLAKTSAEAQTIKYADIMDNSDVTVNDPDFAQVYLRECKRLLEKINRGNQTLYAEAVDVINKNIQKLRHLKSVS